MHVNTRYMNSTRGTSSGVNTKYMKSLVTCHLSPGMRVNTKYMNSTRGTSSGVNTKHMKSTRGTSVNNYDKFSFERKDCLVPWRRLYLRGEVGEKAVQNISMCCSPGCPEECPITHCMPVYSGWVSSCMPVYSGWVSSCMPVYSGWVSSHWVFTVSH